MKIIKIALLITCFLLTGCDQKEGESYTCRNDYSYDDVVEKKIGWNEVLSKDKPSYFIYVYFPTCGHCKEIRQDVICFSLSRDDFFFCEYSKEIPVITYVEDTIGKNKIEEIGIVGTPTLLGVEDGVLTMNIVGKNAIIETLTNLS